MLTDQFPVLYFEISFECAEITRLGNSVRIEFDRFNVIVSYIHHQLHSGESDGSENKKTQFSFYMQYQQLLDFEK